MLLVSGYIIITPDVAALSSTGEGDHLSQSPRHRGRLNQGRLSPDPERKTKTVSSGPGSRWVRKGRAHHEPITGCLTCAVMGTDIHGVGGNASLQVTVPAGWDPGS